MKNKDKILEIIKIRNITQIIHFTKKQNIRFYNQKWVAQY
jgi:hypothetical protein